MVAPREEEPTYYPPKSIPQTQSPQHVYWQHPRPGSCLRRGLAQASSEHATSCALIPRARHKPGTQPGSCHALHRTNHQVPSVLHLPLQDGPTLYSCNICPQSLPGSAPNSSHPLKPESLLIITPQHSRQSPVHPMPRLSCPSFPPLPYSSFPTSAPCPGSVRVRAFWGEREGPLRGTVRSWGY